MAKRNLTITRVEVFYWSDCENPSDDRVDWIRQILESYDPKRELYQIGLPTEEFSTHYFQKEEALIFNARTLLMN